MGPTFKGREDREGDGGRGWGGEEKGRKGKGVERRDREGGEGR